MSNVVERWLGLARIKIQTASGSAKAEMTVEGIAQFGALRDFLYARMRGTRMGSAASTAVASAGTAATPASLTAGRASGATTAGRASGATTAGRASGATTTELTATLRSVAEELKLLRQALEAQKEGDA